MPGPAIIVPTQLVTAAVVAMLQALVGEGGTGIKAVYQGEFEGVSPFPYVVVNQIPGGSMYGPPLVGPEQDAMLQFQITSVGKRSDQAQWMGDMVRASMIGRDQSGVFASAFPTPPGWVCADRLLASAPGGVVAQGSAPNKLFVVNEIYTVCVTPA